MKIGDRIPIRTGTIVNITEYPDLGLTYYCVKMYEPWSKKFDLVYVEAKMLDKLISPQTADDKVISTTHIGEYDEETKMV